MKPFIFSYVKPIIKTIAIMKAREVIHKIATSDTIKFVFIYGICDRELNRMAAIEILSSEDYSNSFRANIEPGNIHGDTLIVYSD